MQIYNFYTHSHNPVGKNLSKYLIRKGLSYLATNQHSHCPQTVYCPRGQVYTQNARKKLPHMYGALCEAYKYLVSGNIIHRDAAGGMACIHRQLPDSEICTETRALNQTPMHFPAPYRGSCCQYCWSPLRRRDIRKGWGHSNPKNLLHSQQGWWRHR